MPSKRLREEVGAAALGKAIVLVWSDDSRRPQFADLKLSEPAPLSEDCIGVLSYGWGCTPHAGWCFRQPDWEPLHRDLTRHGMINFYDLSEVLDLLIGDHVGDVCDLGTWNLGRIEYREHLAVRVAGSPFGHTRLDGINVGHSLVAGRKARIVKHVAKVCRTRETAEQGVIPGGYVHPHAIGTTEVVGRCGIAIARALARRIFAKE